MNTAEPSLLRAEVVADLPVLWALLQRLDLPASLDRHFPVPPHWKCPLTPGEVLSLWLLFLVSEGHHCLNHVDPWVAQHHGVLSATDPIQENTTYTDSFSKVYPCKCADLPISQVAGDLGFGRHGLGDRAKALEDKIKDLLNNKKPVSDSLLLELERLNFQRRGRLKFLQAITPPPKK